MKGQFTVLNSSLSLSFMICIKACVVSKTVIIFSLNAFLAGNDAICAIGKQGCLGIFEPIRPTQHLLEHLATRFSLNFVSFRLREEYSGSLVERVWTS